MKVINYVRTFLAAVFISTVAAHAGDMVTARANTAGVVISKTYIADPLASPLGTPFLIAVSEGVGQANQLGRYTIDFEEVFRLEVINGQLTLVSDGVFTATAANGDQIFGTYTNYRAYGGLVFVGNSVFTGGTGRFEGVTGSETTVGSLEPDLLHFSYTHEGVMSSVGSRGGNGK